MIPFFQTKYMFLVLTNTESLTTHISGVVHHDPTGRRMSNSTLLFKSVLSAPVFNYELCGGEFCFERYYLFNN